MFTLADRGQVASCSWCPPNGDGKRQIGQLVSVSLGGPYGKRQDKNDILAASDKEMP